MLRLQAHCRITIYDDESYEPDVLKNDWQKDRRQIVDCYWGR
jgi:hypothetical protein